MIKLIKLVMVDNVGIAPIMFNARAPTSDKVSFFF